MQRAATIGIAHPSPGQLGGGVAAQASCNRLIDDFVPGCQRQPAQHAASPSSVVSTIAQSRSALHVSSSAGRLRTETAFEVGVEGDGAGSGVERAPASATALSSTAAGVLSQATTPTPNEIASENVATPIRGIGLFENVRMHLRRKDDRADRHRILDECALEPALA